MDIKLKYRIVETKVTFFLIERILVLILHIKMLVEKTTTKEENSNMRCFQVALSISNLLNDISKFSSDYLLFSSFFLEVLDATTVSSPLHLSVKMDIVTVISFLLQFVALASVSEVFTTGY